MVQVRVEFIAFGGEARREARIAASEVEVQRVQS